MPNSSGEVILREFSDSDLGIDAHLGLDLLVC